MTALAPSPARPAASDPAAPSVLIVREAAVPFEAARLADLLAAKLGRTAVVFRRAHAAGGYHAVAAALRDRPGAVVHAFGGAALAVALVAGRGPVLYTATRPPARRDVSWLRAAMRYRDVTVVCDSDAERRRWVTGGLSPERCVLIRPGVSLARSPEARRVARERFGLNDANTTLFTPLPERGPARAGALWTSSLYQVLNPSARLIAWNPPGGTDLSLLPTRLIDPSAVRVMDDATPEAGFAAADVVLLPPGDSCGPALIALAMAAGLPIVATATPRNCELLEDRHTALLAGEGTPKALAQRLFELQRDPALGRRIADRARAEAYELLLASRLLGDFRNVYATLAGRASGPLSRVPNGRGLG